MKYLLMFFILFLPLSGAARVLLEDGRLLVTGQNGILNLSANAAVVTNAVSKPGLRKHAAKGVYALNWWSRREDAVFWDARIPRAGRYRVWLELACPRHSAGSGILISGGADPLRFTVPATKSWNAFDFVSVPGSLGLNKGVNRISLQPLTIHGKWLMVLRRVLLVPVGRKAAAAAHMNGIRAGYRRRQAANTIFETGLNLYRKKQYDGSLGYFLRAVRTDPSFYNAWYHAGLVARRMNRHREAVRYLDHVIRLDPSHYWARLYRVWSLATLRRYREAMEESDRIIMLQRVAGKKLWAGVLWNASVYARFGRVKYWHRSVAYLEKIHRGPYPDEQRDRALCDMATMYRYGGMGREFVRRARIYLREGRDQGRKADQSYHLGNHFKKTDFTRSQKHFRQAVYWYGEALQGAAGKKRPAYLRGRGLARYALEEYKKALPDLEEAHRLRPMKHLKGKIRWACIHLGVGHLVNYRYEEAERLFRRGERYNRKKDSYHARFLFLARNHGRYRHVRPQYVHRILQIVVRNTDASSRDRHGKVIAFRGRIEDRDIVKVKLVNRLLQMYVRTLTRGRLGLHIDQYIHPGTYTGVKRTRTETGGVHFTPNINAVTGDIYSRMLRFAAQYDSIQYYWRAGKFLSVATGGAHSPPLVPYTLYGPLRGFVSMPVEFGRSITGAIPLHEFWHTLENTLSIGPVHGWIDKNLSLSRRMFPDWRGNGEWSWFRYHSAKTMPADALKRARRAGYAEKPYSVINFLRRFPPRNDSGSVERLRKLSAAVPVRERTRAEGYIKKGNDLYKKRRFRAAARMYRKALSHNRYRVFAILRLISISLRLKQQQEEQRLRIRLAGILPTKEHLVHLAYCHLRRKQYPEAERVIRKGLRLHGAPGFRSLLRRVCLLQGKNGEADRLLAVGEAVVIRQSGDTIRLKPESSVIHCGRMPHLRQQVYGNRFILSGWSRNSEYISWRLRVERPGRYRVFLFSASSKKMSGSRMQLSLGSRRINFRVPPSAHFLHYVRTRIGPPVNLDKGVYSVILCASGNRGPWMHLGKLVLEKE